MKKCFTTFALALLLIGVIMDVTTLHSVSASNDITINGHLTYTDQNGAPRPMRQVHVELWAVETDEQGNLIDKEWTGTWTTFDGSYSLTVSGNILAPPNQAIYILVESENSQAARCVKTNGAPYHWGADLTNIITSTGQVYQNVDLTPQSQYSADSAYTSNIMLALDACLNMSTWIYENTNPPFIRGERVTIYYPDNSDDIPWTDWIDEDIHLMDTNIYDWTEITVFHEYAHAVMHADELYGVFGPSGWGPDPHSFDDESSPGFALSEGWAEFMQGVMSDVQGVWWKPGGSQLLGADSNNWYNVQDAGDWDGDIVEGAVAGILYDIWDPVDLGDRDAICRPFEDIFNVMFRHSDDLDSINDFWNRWVRLWPDLYTSKGPLCYNFYVHGIDKDSGLGLTPDTGSITIENGNPYATDPERWVWISIDPDWAGGSGIQFVRFRNENEPHWEGWHIWLLYTGQPLVHQLSEGDGLKTVHAQFKDYCGHISDVYGDFTDSIRLDTGPPTGSMTIDWNGDHATAKLREVTLNVLCHDYGSGVSEVRFMEEGFSWQPWEPYDIPFTKQWTIQGHRGLIIVYCQAKDRVGNSVVFHNEIFFTDAKLTQVFFNLNPNPALEYGTVELKGIVIDEDGNPVPPSIDPHIVPITRVKLYYRSLVSGDLTWQSRFLEVDEGGTFSATIDASWGLDLRGEICFRARYIGSDDYVDSEAEACLRLISTEVQLLETSLYFNINPSHVLHDGSAVLTGVLLDDTGLPIQAPTPVNIALSFDDGASWESEVTVYTGDNGIFRRTFRFDRKGSTHFDVGTYVLVRASCGLEPVGKTAYMRITDDIGEIVIREPLAYDWNPLNLIRTRSPREVYFELPGEYVNFVDPTSFTINNTVAITPECLLYRDLNGDGKLELTLNLNSSIVSNFILSRNITTGNVTLFLSGRFYDNTLFGQTMLITIRMPGDVNIDGTVDIKDVAQAAIAFGSYDGNARWDPNADENEDGRIDIRDLVAICKKFGTKYI